MIIHSLVPCTQEHKSRAKTVIKADRKSQVLMRQQDTRVVLYTIQEILHTAALRGLRKEPQAPSLLLTPHYRGGPASSTFLILSLQFYLGSAPTGTRLPRPQIRLFPGWSPLPSLQQPIQHKSFLAMAEEPSSL